MVCCAMQCRLQCSGLQCGRVFLLLVLPCCLQHKVWHRFSCHSTFLWTRHSRLKCLAHIHKLSIVASQSSLSASKEGRQYKLPLLPCLRICNMQDSHHWGVCQHWRNLAAPEEEQQQPVGLLQHQWSLAIQLPHAHQGHQCAWRNCHGT